jgi:hypothetical protein
MRVPCLSFKDDVEIVGLPFVLKVVTFAHYFTRYAMFRTMVLNWFCDCKNHCYGYDQSNKRVLAITFKCML